MKENTRQDRIEEILRESQAVYHSLVEQLPVGVFRKDAAGRYILVNAEFCRLYGKKAGCRAPAEGNSLLEPGC